MQIKGLSRVGEIASYDFSSNGVSKGILVNQAPPSIANSFNPSLYNGTIIKRGKFIKNGSKFPLDGYVTLANSLGSRSTFTILFRGKVNGAQGSGSLTYPGDAYILDFRNANFIIQLTTPPYTQYVYNYTSVDYGNFAFCLDNGVPRLYLNGIQLKISTNPPPGVTITINSLISGRTNTPWNNETIAQDERIYNRVLSLSEIKAYHNNFASKIFIKEDFKQYAVGATRLNKWINRIPANAFVKEITTRPMLSDPRIPIRLGTKYLAGSGVVQETRMRLPSTAAYGTWEFDFLTATTSSQTGFFIIGNGTNIAYGATDLWLIVASRKLVLFKGGGTALITSNITYDFNTWYHIKITRTQLGVSTLYINYNFVGSVTDGASTTCRWMGCDYFVGIANLVVKQGITV